MSVRLSKRRDLLDEDICTGAPKPKLRTWLAQLKEALERFPMSAVQPVAGEESSAQVLRSWMCKLIVKRCSGELLGAMDW